MVDAFGGKINTTTYTSIIGGYDEPHQAINGGEVVRLGDPQESGQFTDPNPRRRQRYCKMVLGPRLPGEAKIYIDGNMQLLRPADEIANELLADHDIAILKHPERDCLYQEIEECLRLGTAYGNPDELRKQKADYGALGFPAHFGLWSCGFLVYRSNYVVRFLMESWWNMYQSGSERDQISFPVALCYAQNQSRIRLNTIDEHPWRSSYFKIHPHRPATPKSGK